MRLSVSNASIIACEYWHANNIAYFYAMQNAKKCDAMQNAKKCEMLMLAYSIMVI